MHMNCSIHNTLRFSPEIHNKLLKGIHEQFSQVCFIGYQR